MFLWIGAKFAFFHSDGKIPCVRQDLKTISRGFQMDLSHNLSIRILIISSVWASLGWSLLIMFLISSTEKSTSMRDFSVIKGKTDCNLLPLSINEHCFVLPRISLRFRSFLWSQWKIYHREKVVTYREFFYHLKEYLINSNRI